MDFLELSKFRCSVRDYSSEPVERKKLEYVLEAARMAPSAVNFQPWYFLVIREEENKKILHDCYTRDWFKTAPVYIIICGDHNQAWKRSFDEKDHCDIDVSIAVEHICLAAAEQLLGTCWVCNFDDMKCAAAFNMPKHVEPIAIIPIGYPKDKDMFMTTPKKRKAANEVVKWEKF